MHRVGIAFLVSFLSSPSLWSQTFLSPQHDVRVALLAKVPGGVLERFGSVCYGHWIRLGDFGCGDPKFRLHIGEGCPDRDMQLEGCKDLNEEPRGYKPKFAAQGSLDKDGKYSTRLTVDTTWLAKIYGVCLGFSCPSVGGRLTTECIAGHLENGGTLDFKGKLSIGPWQFIKPLTFDVSFSTPLPLTPLQRLPVVLTPSPGSAMEFGRFTNGSWISEGKSKEVPLWLNAGSFGGDSAHNAQIVMDGTVGTAPRTRPFSSQADARREFESDLPLWEDASIGVSFSQSFFGEAAPGSQGSGLLSKLLPIRISGSVPYRFLFWAGALDFETFLDGAVVKLGKGKTADTVTIELSSSRSSVRRVSHGRSGAGAPQSGKGTVAGKIVLDHIHFKDGFLRFRVADFRLKVGSHLGWIPLRRWTLPLQSALGGGAIPVAKSIGPMEFALPECVGTPEVRLKALRKCNPADDGNWYLSFAGGTQKQTITIDEQSLRVRLAGNSIQASLKLKIQP